MIWEIWEGVREMSVLRKFLALVSLAFLAFPAVAFASDEEFRSENRTVFGGEEFRSEFRLNGDELRIRDEFGGEEFRFEANGEEFKVEGIVNDVSGDSFAVGFFPVMLGSAEVEGDLMVGAEVKAEGMVVDGVNFAEEVKVEEAEVDDD